MGERVLVTVEIRFVTEEDPQALADRVQEAASLVVGKEALEEFRARSMPLSPRRPRPVD